MSARDRNGGPDEAPLADQLEQRQAHAARWLAHCIGRRSEPELHPLEQGPTEWRCPTCGVLERRALTGRPGKEDHAMADEGPRTKLDGTGGYFRLGGAAPASAGAAHVTVARTIAESVPVASLDAGAANTLWAQKRDELIANPQLADDAAWMRGYGLLASRAQGHDVKEGERLIGEIVDGKMRAPGTGERRRSVLTAEQWDRRLGPPQGDEGPDGEWIAEDLNLGADVCAIYGFPPHTLDAFARVERALAGRAWSEADTRRALAAKHGPVLAARMIGNAEYMWKRFVKEPWFRARALRWEGATGEGLNHPELIETLHRTMEDIDPDNPNWEALDRAVVAEEQARVRAGQAAAEEARAAEAAAGAEHARAHFADVDQHHKRWGRIEPRGGGR